MTNEIRNLYGELILEHCRHPHNKRRLPDASHQACADNPLCGDQIELYLKVVQGVIQDAGFQGVSCAIATASASLMTQALIGNDLAVAQRLSSDFHHMMADDCANPSLELSRLQVFAEVRDFPARVLCATLAWQAFECRSARLTGLIADFGVWGAMEQKFQLGALVSRVFEGSKPVPSLGEIYTDSQGYTDHPTLAE